MHWGKVGCACLLLPRFRQCSLDSLRERSALVTFMSVIRTLPEQHAQTGFNFHHYKLVFHLRVTITIKGETQMGSVSNKDSMGTNIALSYSSLSNLSLAYFS